MKYNEQAFLRVSYPLRKPSKISEILKSKKYKRLSDARIIAISCGVGVGSPSSDLSSSQTVSYEDVLYDLEACGNGSAECPERDQGGISK